MTKFKIPDDVRDHIRKKTAKRIFLLILLEAVMLALIVFIGERVFERFVQFSRLLIYIVLMVVPFFITGVPFKMIDKYWEGEVIAVDVETGYTATKEAKGRLVGENTVWLTIKKSDGTVFREKAKSYHFQAGVYDDLPSIKPEHFLNKYKVGSRVYHLRGLPNLVVIEPNNQSMITCAVCGQGNDHERKKCWSCGHTLIKFR